jgi:long-chain fatty acid transport protein
MLLLWAVPAAANPLDAFGFGARSVALGGAVTASVDDFSANYYNPAALASLTDLRLELGYLYTDPTLTLNGGDLGVDAPRGFQGGLTVPGEVFGHRVAVSLGLYLPDQRITRVRALPQAQPRFELFDNRPQRIVITSGLALEVVDHLYVGGALTYLSNTRGVLDIQGQVHLTDKTRTRLFSKVDVDLAAIRYPSAGVLYAPDRGLRVGASFRDEFSLALDLDVDVSGQIVAGPKDNVVVPDGHFILHSSNHNLFSPRQFVLGAAWKADRWLVGADVAWLQWSRFPSPTAEVQIDLALDPFQFEVPAPDKPEKPRFHDIFVPRVGGEYRLIDGPHFGLTARAGYFYEPTPAPDQPGRTNYVDLDKHGASAGLGLAFADFGEVFPKPIHLDLAAQGIFMATRRYTKDDPADPVGDYTARGHIWGGAATLSFLF